MESLSLLQWAFCLALIGPHQPHLVPVPPAPSPPGHKRLPCRERMRSPREDSHQQRPPSARLGGGEVAATKVTHPKSNPCVKRLKVISSPPRGPTPQLPRFLAGKHTASWRISLKHAQINGHCNVYTFISPQRFSPRKRTKQNKPLVQPPVCFIGICYAPAWPSTWKGIEVWERAKRSAELSCLASLLLTDN